jgi:hypothetical protein
MSKTMVLVSFDRIKPDCSYSYRMGLGDADEMAFGFLWPFGSSQKLSAKLPNARLANGLSEILFSRSQEYFAFLG